MCGLLFEYDVSTIGKTVFRQILYEHPYQGFKEFKFIEFLLILYKMYQKIFKTNKTQIIKYKTDKNINYI